MRVHNQETQKRPLKGLSGMDRSGAAIVELALVLPLVLLLLTGIMEMGRAVMVSQILTNGAREGARAAALPGSTQSGVEGVIDDYLADMSITGFTRNLSADPASTDEGDPITVTISVNYENVSWLPTGALRWLQNKTLSGVVTMRKEPE